MYKHNFKNRSKKYMIRWNPKSAMEKNNNSVVQVLYRNLNNARELKEMS